MKYMLMIATLLLLSSPGCRAQSCGDDDLMKPRSGNSSHLTQNKSGDPTMLPIQKSDTDWKKELSAEEYRVLREKGTEIAFTGKYYKHDADGVYRCAGCGTELFRSVEKYHSGSGWPSFYAPKDSKSIIIREDRSHGMLREEVLCAACGGHLGHVFDDGPQPTGLRYCINSVSLDFESKNVEKE
ncbi:MAG: peptide-methionine (R)-S-oxide reductase MsrB [Bacteroidota bacterium]|nr:peptide-methionine (R)-S-oxide reductase MsrB [Bacteroidota bacterium]